MNDQQQSFHKTLQPMRILLLLLLAFASLTFSACSNATTGVDTPDRIVKDDSGRMIGVPSEILRTVSLAPNLTEIIFAIGAGDKLVGVTSYCNYPKEALAIDQVGDTLKPNIENIIALKPDIVFVSTASQLEAFTETLAKQNIRVFVTNPNSLEDIYESILKIGDLFSEKANAIAVVNALKERVAAVASKTRGAHEMGVFVQLDKSPFTIGRDSYLTDLIERAGGKSVTGEVATPYFRISKEMARASNPDVIILSTSEDNMEPNDVFENSKAVINGRVVRINADILSRPGPRIVDGLEKIASSLHPEKF